DLAVRPAPNRTLRVELEGRQREIRRRRDALASDRPSAPVEPLRFAELRRELDPGTALLFFATGEERTDLLVLARGTGGGAARLTAFPLSVSREDLERRVGI